MISPEKISLKMKAYGHGELNTEKFTNVEYIQDRISKHRDVFSDVKLKKVEIDNSFPDYLVKNKDKFINFIA